MKYIFTLFLLFVSFNAFAIEPLRVTYGLYASGFNVLDIVGTYNITDDKYDLSMDLKTQGMLGKLAPWSGSIQSNGINKDVESVPLYHSFSSTWRDETEQTEFKFNQSGQLTSTTISKDGKSDNKMPAKEVYKDKPIDMLSAMFRAMNAASCASKQPAFDKKRRFDMVFRSKGKDVLEKTGYSIFQGEAEICEVEIIPVAGKWREKPRGWMSIQGQAKDKGQLPRIWFGKVRDDIPPIPVRFLIKTNYGAMVMHLKGVQS